MEQEHKNIENILEKAGLGADTPIFKFDKGEDEVELESKIEAIKEGGKSIIVIGAGLHMEGQITKHLMAAIKDTGSIVVVDDSKTMDNLNLRKLASSQLSPLSFDSTITYKYLAPPKMDDFISGVPKKLEMLRKLELSPEQLDYFQNAPPQRLEGESQEDYKTRRMLNKLIIKYRGEF